MGGLAKLRQFVAENREVFKETPELKGLLAANLLSAFLAGILIPVMPLFLLSRGFSLLQLGGLFSMVALSTLGVQLIAGRYHRFFGRREVVLGLLFFPVVLFPMYLWVQTPLQFLGLSAASSIASAAAGPGLQVLMAEIAPARSRATVFAYIGTAWSFSYAMALIVAGLLLGIGYAAVFYVGSLLSMLSFLITATFVLRDRTRRKRLADPRRLGEAERALHFETVRLEKEVRRWRVDVGRGIAGVLKLLPAPKQAVRNLRWASLHTFLFGISVAIYPVYFPIYLRQLGLPVEWLGLVIASSWLTFGLCQPFGARYADKSGRHRTVIFWSLLAAAALNFVMAEGSLLWVVVAWVLIGIADGLGRPVTSALFVLGVPPTSRGQVFGWTGASNTLARIMAPFGLALLIRGKGIAFGLHVVTFTILAAAVAALFIENLYTRPEPAPAPVPQGDAA